MKLPKLPFALPKLDLGLIANVVVAVLVVQVINRVI